VTRIYKYMVTPQIPAVLVKGAPGIGKTEICKAVYWKFKNKDQNFNMPFIDLVGSKSTNDVIESIAKGFGIFRNDLSQEMLFSILCSFVADYCKRGICCVYLDNFEDIWNVLELEAQNDLSDNLKKLADMGMKFLISSQANFTFGEIVQVDTLDSDKNTEIMSFDELLKTDQGNLFIKTLGRTLRTNEHDSFITLMKEMNGHPLSIVLTSTYCRQCSSINDVKDIWSDINSHIPGERRSHDSLSCALELAWRKISTNKVAVFIWALHTYSIYPLDDSTIWQLNKVIVRRFHRKDLINGCDMLYAYGLTDIKEDGKIHMLLSVKKNFEKLNKTGNLSIETEKAFSAWILVSNKFLKCGISNKKEKNVSHFNRALYWLPQCFNIVELCFDKKRYQELLSLLINMGSYYHFDSVCSVSLLKKLTRNFPKDLPMRSVLYLHLGELLNCAGKPKEAFSAYNKAELLFREEHTDFGLAVVYFAKGELLSRTGKPNEAFSAYNKAEILFKKENQDVGFAYVLHSKGKLLAKIGKLDEALTSYNEAKMIFEKEHSSMGMAYVIQSRDHLLSHTLTNDHALENLDDIEKFYCTLRDSNNENIDDILRDFDELEHLYRKENDEISMANVLLFRSELLSRIGRNDGVLEGLDDAEKIYNKIHHLLGIANVMKVRGYLQLYNRNPFGAKKYYEKALQLYRQEQDVEEVFYTLSDMMICSKLMGDTNGFETYKNELIELLPKQPEYVLKKIAMQ